VSCIGLRAAGVDLDYMSRAVHSCCAVSVSQFGQHHGVALYCCFCSTMNCMSALLIADEVVQCLAVVTAATVVSCLGTAAISQPLNLLVVIACYRQR
jgi:hypothetical protein